MRALILGAAAGGGIPQWNCGCANCAAARRSEIAAQTQSSIAVSLDGLEWVVLNASPDIRQQLTANAQLHPVGLRGSPLASVVLTNGDIDHVAGLLSLREKQSFAVYCTPEISEIIAANPIFAALDTAMVSFESIAIGERFTPAQGVEMTFFATPGKVPLYMEATSGTGETLGGQTVGVSVRSANAHLVYAPGCARVTDELKLRFDAADALLFDGTLYTDDEMIAQSLGAKTGRRMGHMPISGEGGSLEALSSCRARRKIYCHINNSNPVWRPQSLERQNVNAAGWEIAFDGMELTLP